MNTVNYNDTGAVTDSTYVGVDNNRLVVTTRPEDYGTFAVTTEDTYTTIPFAKARSFRINNLTGKMVGIRRRHNKFIVDNFDDTAFPNWDGAGTIESGVDLEGVRGASVTGLKYKVITTEVMNDDSEVEVTFKTPVTSSYSIKIGVWDSGTRVTTPGASASAIFDANEGNTSVGTIYKVVFRLRKSVSKADVFLEGPNGREVISEDIDGQFGINDMQNSVVSIDASVKTVVDPIIYQQKVNFTHELMFSTSSYTFPCQDNISEYEVINLGSDALNYSDNTDNITLTGFYVA